MSDPALPSERSEWSSNVWRLWLGTLEALMPET